MRLSKEISWPLLGRHLSMLIRRIICLELVSETAKSVGVHDRSKWNGENILGQVLTEIREGMLASEPEISHQVYTDFMFFVVPCLISGWHGGFKTVECTVQMPAEPIAVLLEARKSLWYLRSCGAFVQYPLKQDRFARTRSEAPSHPSCAILVCHSAGSRQLYRSGSHHGAHGAWLMHGMAASVPYKVVWTLWYNCKLLRAMHAALHSVIHCANEHTYQSNHVLNLWNTISVAWVDDVVSLRQFLLKADVNG